MHLRRKEEDVVPIRQLSAPEAGVIRGKGVRIGFFILKKTDDRTVGNIETQSDASLSQVRLPSGIGSGNSDHRGNRDVVVYDYPNVSETMLAVLGKIFSGHQELLDDDGVGRPLQRKRSMGYVGHMEPEFVFGPGFVAHPIFSPFLFHDENALALTSSIRLYDEAFRLDGIERKFLHFLRIFQNGERSREGNPAILEEAFGFQLAIRKGDGFLRVFREDVIQISGIHSQNAVREQFHGRILLNEQNGAAFFSKNCAPVYGVLLRVQKFSRASKPFRLIAHVLDETKITPCGRRFSKGHWRAIRLRQSFLPRTGVSSFFLSVLNANICI